MSKLNQIIAIEKGIKSRVYSDVGVLHKALQKPDLFSGISKEYQAKDDEGEALPSEKKRVQLSAADVMRNVARLTTELFDVTARKDFTNMTARADLKVGTETITGIPVSYLLFLEKQLTDLRTLVGVIPVLDEGENWTFDDKAGIYKADPIQTHRTKKVQKPLVLYPATAEHPAQTQIVAEDVIAGYWTTIKQSGAMPKTDKEKIADRVEKLLRAVKEARESANVIEEEKTPKVGDLVFGYLLGE